MTATVAQKQRTRISQATPPLTAWSHLINPASINHDDARWRWHDEQLVHADYQPQSVTRRPNSRLQKWIVDHVYASQRQSPQVEACLQELLGGLGTSEWGLNLGAGDTQLHERVLNLDIHDAPHMNIINEGTELPFADNSLDLVISQEVLEHIADPFRTIDEVLRVLRPGGNFYCQVPFQIGFHPGPCDYWRFSRQAFEHLFETEQWKLQKLELSLGHGSGFYRMLVEFMAVNASILSARLYRPVKGITALLAWPLQWLDKLTHLSSEKDRIPGGYFCVAEKR